MTLPAFPRDDLNQVKRIPNRGAYDRQTIYAIIDAAPMGHVAILSDQTHPLVVIPMLHGRSGDTLLFHGARTSRLLQYLGSGRPATVAFTLVDGYVLAKSLFHHSMNYRSAIVFGQGEELRDDAEKLEGLRMISEKLLPGRWDDARLPNPQEMKATSVVRLHIESASAKIRSGGPKEEPEDVGLPHWSGVIPTQLQLGQPVTDQLSEHCEVPDYVQKMVRGWRGSGTE